MLGPQPIEHTQTWDMDGAAANKPSSRATARTDVEVATALIMFGHERMCPSRAAATDPKRY